MKDRTIVLPEPIKISHKRNLADFTKPELDRIYALANFTEDESEYFKLRSKGKSNVHIFMSMCISESKLHDIRRKVESKIDRVMLSI